MRSVCETMSGLIIQVIDVTSRLIGLGLSNSLSSPSKDHDNLYTMNCLISRFLSSGITCRHTRQTCGLIRVGDLTPLQMCSQRILQTGRDYNQNFIQAIALKIPLHQSILFPTACLIITINSRVHSTTDGSLPLLFIQFIFIMVQIPIAISPRIMEVIFIGFITFVTMF